MRLNLFCRLCAWLQCFYLVARYGLDGAEKKVTDELIIERRRAWRIKQEVPRGK